MILFFLRKNMIFSKNHILRTEKNVRIYELWKETRKEIETFLFN